MDLGKIKDICQIFGPSGSEEDIREYIIEEIKDYVDSYEIDPLGNLIAHKKGEGPKVMLAAHMDQIGLMVNFIDDKGYARFSTIGGLGPNSLINQRFRFKNGVQATIGFDRVDNFNKDFTPDKMYLDLGVTSKEEAEKLVQIGDTCIFAQDTYINEDTIMTPYLDNRIGCFVQIEALKAIKKPAFDMYFVFTVQEEIGLKGAQTSAYGVEPDYGIAFDVSTSFDTPNAMKLPAKIGEGAAIKIRDASLICDDVIINHMTKVAEDNNIKHQREILVGGGTDAGAIQRSKAGVPSGGISIICRNIHSAGEICSVSDVKDCISLATKFLETPIK